MLLGDIHQLQRADAARIPVGEQDINFLLLALASDVPSSVVHVLRVFVAEFFLGFDSGDERALFQIDDM